MKNEKYEKVTIAGITFLKAKNKQAANKMALLSKNVLKLANVHNA